MRDEADAAAAHIASRVWLLGEAQELKGTMLSTEAAFLAGLPLLLEDRACKPPHPRARPPDVKQRRSQF